MSLFRVVERFLVEVREEEERAFNQNPPPPNNLLNPPHPLPHTDMEAENSTTTNPPSPPRIDMRRLENRVEQLEREIPLLSQQIHRLRRQLAFVMAEKDRLQEEVNRLRGKFP